MSTLHKDHRDVPKGPRDRLRLPWVFLSTEDFGARKHMLEPGPSTQAGRREGDVPSGETL